MTASLLWSGIQAFLFSLILTPIIRDIFSAYKIVDRPDAYRKKHPQAIPRVGGIAVALSYLLATYLIANVRSESLSLVARVLPSATVVFVVGLVDDFVGLKPWQKLAGQLTASLMAYWAGVRILHVAGYAPESWLSFLITIVWLLACTNAFNLVDGLDGLAAGIGFFATVTIFIAAIIQHNVALCAATLPLAGCLLAFLCYNFNPATIFLGDCGSLVIGFLLGCYSVIWSEKSVTLLGMAAPVIAFSLPLLDVLLAVIRRFLRRQPIFTADRGHIHHRLIDRGLSPRRVVLIIYGVCGVAAALSLLQGFTASRYVAVAVAGAFLLTLRVGIGYLGYSEFTLAARVLRIRTFQQALDAQLSLENFTIALLGAKTRDECWQAIRKHCPQLGFSGVHLEMDGTIYREWAPHVGGTEYWTIRISLEGGGFIEMAREFRAGDAHTLIAQVADLLHYTLSERLRGHGGLAERSAAAS